jgi:2-polyprenyl-6-hydroxyphenyl methylase/3-demethylubiquinone-9 3-methyltransferase
MAQAVEIRWWKNYLRKKPVGEYLDWKRQYWLDLIASYNSQLELEKKQQILDAGCGPAGIFMILDIHEVKAIDPLLDAYEKLEHFDPDTYSWVDFEKRSIEQLSNKDQFDGIFCLNAINHVENLQEAVQNLYDSAKPGAWMMISSDAHHYPILKPIFRLIPGDVLHPHQHDKKDYENIWQQSGWKIEKVEMIKRDGIFDYWMWLLRKPQVGNSKME